MPKSLSGCICCRLRKKKCGGREGTSEDCINCLKLNIQCLRNYGRCIPRALRGLGLEKLTAKWTRRRVNRRGPRLPLESFISQVLESACGPNVPVSLHPGAGGATLTPLYLAPPTAGYPGELSPTFSCSSPSSSFVSSQTSTPSPILEMPTSSQPRPGNDPASASEYRTPSAASNSSLPHNTEHPTAPWLNVDGVNISPSTRLGIHRSGGTNQVMPTVPGLTEWKSYQAGPHRHNPTIQPGFLGVPPLQNHPFAVHQALGGHAFHNAQYIDPVTTVCDGFHTSHVATYNDWTQSIQGDIRNQKPPVPKIVVSDAEPHWNESGAGSAAHSVGMVSAARRSRPAQSSTALAQGHQAPGRGRLVLRDATGVSTSLTLGPSRAPIAGHTRYDAPSHNIMGRRAGQSLTTDQGSQYLYAPPTRHAAPPQRCNALNRIIPLQALQPSPPPGTPTIYDITHIRGSNAPNPEWDSALALRAWTDLPESTGPRYNPASRNWDGK